MRKTALFGLYIIFPLMLMAGVHIDATKMSLQTVLQLPPRADNPRNSEGDFVELKDGRILFVYTRFSGGAGDHAAAHLAGRYSADDGLTWTNKDFLIIPNEVELNIMSVSLLRLADDRIALFYLRKQSLSDCRPVVRFSNDEAQTWSKAVTIIPDSQNGYFVLNNDRVVQLQSGRLIAPVARHKTTNGCWTSKSAYGTIMCYLSDDSGNSRHRSKSVLDGVSPEDPLKERVMLQEPGVVELDDGRLMMFCRTDAGRQYLSWSIDKGDSWTPLRPSNIISPLSPASMERIPNSSKLLLLWNNHDGIDADLKGKRTPLCAAVSKDNGQTWEQERVLENNPHGWYCYTAIHFTRITCYRGTAPVTVGKTTDWLRPMWCGYHYNGCIRVLSQNSQVKTVVLV